MEYVRSSCDSCYAPFYFFVDQIYCCFHCLSLTETNSLFFLRWTFLAINSEVTNCIVGVIWFALVLLLGFIDDPNQNLFVFSFYNFDFKTENCVIGYNLVENILSPILIFANVLYSAAGTCGNNIEFISVRLLEFINF